MATANAAMDKALRLIRTVQALRVRQIANRFTRRFARPPSLADTALPRRPAAGAWRAAGGRAPTMLAATRFRFLNLAATIEAPADWNRADLPRLWRYNLHYFDDLQAGGAADRHGWHLELITRWLAANPPLSGPGWEPYPISRRLVNWIGWALAGGELSAPAQQSLVVQTRALAARLEFHLLGNHLFANAKALVFAGTFFAGPEADGWRQRGLALLAREIDEQILADGGHFELSPMYHAVILEDLLDLIQLAALFPHELSDAAQRQGWAARANAMLGWLAAMQHPDGDIALFNDSAFDQARRPADLAAYAARFGLASPLPAPGLRHLAVSGYARLQRGPWQAHFDMAAVGARYLAGHGHADTLAFELSVSGARLISNGGTSTYEPGPERDRERATAAHATIEIDGENSSEVWGGFRVGRRARPFHIATTERDAALIAAASHDGYRFLRGKPVHRREIAVSTAAVVITDRVTGAGRHRVVGRLPLHPAVEQVERIAGGWQVRLGGEVIAIEVSGAEALSEADGSYAPAFGVVLPRPVLTWAADVPLPLAVVTRFSRIPPP